MSSRSIHPDRDSRQKSGPSPTASRPTTRNLVARALALGNDVCTRHHRQAHPARRRPRWRLHRRCHCAAVGPVTPSDAASLAQAADLGADISFCLVGGRARVTGIGEVIEPLPHIDQAVTLVIPPLAVSTPAAYRAWDDLGGPTVDGPNDLEPAALAVEPQLRTVARCDRRTDRRQRPTLAGSGATWFTEGKHSKRPRRLSRRGRCEW